jgi:nickel transport protein
MQNRTPGCHKRHDRSLVLVASLFFLLAAPAPAWAHKVNVFAYVEGKQVVVEGYFADGRKCRDSAVEVLDRQGNKLLEGKTNEEGRFAFSTPVHADLLIRLNASSGHQAEYTVPAEDLPGGEPAAPLSRKEAMLPATKPAASAPPEPAQAEDAALLGRSDIDAAALEEMIDRAVARQVTPLRRALEEERERRRVVDIIGGIGYIIGLMGLIAYFRSRRKGS